MCAVAASLPTPGEKPRSIFLGFVAPDVLARYVGVYNGNYLANKRTIEVSLSGGQLIAKIIGAAAVDGGEMRQLVPLSQTEFEGLGIGYRFIVDDKEIATDLVETHNSGDSRFPRKSKFDSSSRHQ